MLPKYYQWTPRSLSVLSVHGTEHEHEQYFLFMEHALQVVVQMLEHVMFLRRDLAVKGKSHQRKGSKEDNSAEGLGKG